MVLLCLVCASLSAKEDPGLTKVAEGIYARIVSPDDNAVANSGVAILEQSVLVFDAHFTPEAGASLLAAIRSVTPNSVRYIVNSHWHADHTHGNQAFAGAQLISSSNARRDMLQNDLPSLNRTVRVAKQQLEKLHQAVSKESDAAERQKMREQIKAREEYLQTVTRLNITVPVITVDENTVIREGKQEARILFLGAGHTDGDIVLFFPAQKVVFAGDLFFNNAIPNVQDANILEWMKTLDGLLKLDAATFVPGHGPIGSKKDVQAFLHYLEELKSLVSPAVERGDSLEQATRDLLLPEKYSSYQFQNFFPSNVQKMYTELKAQQVGSSPAIAAPKAEQRRP